VPRADLRDRVPVAVRRCDRAQGRPHDRLCHEGRHASLTRGDDRGVQLRRQRSSIAEGMGRSLAGPVRVGRGDVAEAPQPRGVRAAQGLAPREVQGAEAVPVVAPPPRDHDVAPGLAAGQVVGARHLEGSLDRLRATGDRVDRGGVERQECPYLGGVGLQGLGGERGAVGVRNAAGLGRHDRGDFGSPVADPHHDRSTGGIKVGTSVGVPDRRAGRTNGDGEAPSEDARKDTADGRAGNDLTHGSIVRSRRSPGAP
jgi:hypothetical protein